MMFELIIIFLLALAFTLLIAGGTLGKRGFYPLLSIFALMFLPLWIVALWVPPTGPLMYGIPWVQLLVAGIFFALMAYTIGTFYSDYDRLPRTKQNARRQFRQAAAGSAFFLFVAMAIILIYWGYAMTVTLAD